MTMRITIRARWAHGFLWVMVGWVVAVIVGLVVVAAVTRGHAAPSAQSAGDLSLPTLAQPFVNGQKTTVADAQAAAGFTVPMPNVTAANSGNLTQTWLDSDQRQVALVFDGGKLTIMMSPATYKDPTSEFETFIAENNAVAALGQVNGQPALVIQPDTDVNKSNAAWVEFEQNGIDVNVVSDSYGTETILKAAESMQAGAVP